MATAGALAHVNRLPALLIVGDVSAGHRPDPVLQRIEDFDDGTISANDCFKPVARCFEGRWRESFNTTRTGAHQLRTNSRRSTRVTRSRNSTTALTRRAVSRFSCHTVQ